MIRDSELFTLVAREGKVVDKDAVVESLVYLRVLYLNSGVPLIDVNRNLNAIETAFYGGTRLEQFRIARHIENLVNKIS